MACARLTLRDATDRWYLPANPGLAPRTRQKLSHQWNRWERFTNNPMIQQISPSTFSLFRSSCLSAGLSPTTIEDVVSDARCVLRSCISAGVIKACPEAGKRLKRSHRLRPTPTLESFDRVLRAARFAVWPRHKLLPTRWWTTCLASAYFLALRRSDLLRIPLSSLSSPVISICQRKTGQAIRLPVHPVLHGFATDGELGCVGSAKQFRGQLAELCRRAGVPSFTLQSVRRLAAQEWEKARAGCGGFVLGHSHQGADRFYLDPFQCLAQAMPLVALPAVFGTSRRVAGERQLIQTFRKLNAKHAAAAIKIVEELAGTEV